MKRNLAAVLLSALLLLTAAGCNGTSGESSLEEEAPPPEPLGLSEEAAPVVSNEGDFETIVATLGDYEVTLAEYSFFYRIYQAELEYDAMFQNFTAENMQEYWEIKQDDGKTNRQHLGEMALTTAKEYNVLYNLGVQKGTAVSDQVIEESEDYIDGFLSSLENNEEEFLKTYKMTPEHIKAMYRRLDLADQYRQEVMNAIELSEDEIKAAYDEAKDIYDQVTVRHVLILCDSQMTEEAQAQAKEKAEDILKQLENGADIAELAAEYSEDPGSSENGGEYTFGRGEMVSEFETWAYEAEIGDTGMVKSLYGYHIMEMMGRSTYEDVKESIAQELRYVQLNDALQPDLEIVDSPDWSVNSEAIDGIVAEAWPMYP